VEQTAARIRSRAAAHRDVGRRWRGDWETHDIGCPVGNGEFLAVKTSSWTCCRTVSCSGRAESGVPLKRTVRGSSN